VAVTTIMMEVGVAGATASVFVGVGSITTTVAGGLVGGRGRGVAVARAAGAVGFALSLDRALPNKMPKQQTEINTSRPSPPHSNFRLVVIISLPSDIPSI
jgi:hypothetical protein